MKVTEIHQGAVLLRCPTEHVAVVTLNRPEARNAVNTELAQSLDAVVKALEADPQIRAVVLTGQGDRAFCAGADLKEVAVTGTGTGRSTPDGGFAGFVASRRRKVWIAAVNGPALAGGFEIMLACDFALCVPQAVFGLPEVKRGLAATAGGLFRLPRRIPRGRALELIATGDTITAEQALSWGLVNQVVPYDQLLPRCLEVAQRIAANAPLSVMWSLELAREAHSSDESDFWVKAQELTQRIRATEDSYEGPRAFAEKRPAQWKGR